MPAAIDPGGRYAVSLQIDKDKDPKPTFEFIFLTGRQQRQLLEIYEDIGSDPAANVKGLDKVFNMLRKFLTGWLNMPIDYDPAALEDLINLTEAMELINRLLLQIPEPAQKKS